MATAPSLKYTFCDQPPPSEVKHSVLHNLSLDECLDKLELDQAENTFISCRRGRREGSKFVGLQDPVSSHISDQRSFFSLI